MNQLARFLYRYKVVIFNLLLAVFFAAVDPRLFQDIDPRQDFHYYLGVAMLLMLFFEFAGIYYKANFIYSMKGAREKKIPLLISISFFPRLLVSGLLLILAFIAMDIIGWSDFLILPITAYAALKEFWVRAQLLRPEQARGLRPAKLKVWAGEAMLFLFILVSYYVFWEVYLLNEPRLMLMIMHPNNYVFVALAVLLLLSALEMPYFLEEYIRGKSRRDQVLAILSLLLPTSAILFRLFMMGYLRGVYEISI